MPIGATTLPAPPPPTPLEQVQKLTEQMTNPDVEAERQQAALRAEAERRSHPSLADDLARLTGGQRRSGLGLP